MPYSIIWVGGGRNSSNSKNIFRLQIKVIRIMKISRNKYSCRELFKKLRILQFYSQFVFSLITFVINSCDFLNQILCCTILIPDIKIIFTFNMRVSQCIKKVYTILASRFLIIFIQV